MEDSKQHIILVHGYLLRGPGSNIYSCNLAKTWKAQGHAVTVYCQDPQAKLYPWVDDFIGPNECLPEARISLGKVRVVVPDIGGLLPVYNYDKYPGYTVKTIPQCTTDEIEAHIRKMSEAIRRGINLWGCDQIIANHALLSPVNVKRAVEGLNVPFKIKIHGSALVFTLQPFPKFKPYAIEAFRECSHIIAGTHHVVQQLKGIFEDDYLQLNDKLIIIPPGMDPDLFIPSTNMHESLQEFRATIKNHIQTEEYKGRNAAIISYPAAEKNIHNELKKLGTGYNIRVCDSDLLERIPDLQLEDPIIIYFGMMMPFKGVAEILLSWLQVTKRYHRAKLILVGFGEYREHLETMIYALKHDDIALFESAALSPNDQGVTFLEQGIDVRQYFPRTLSNKDGRSVLQTSQLNRQGKNTCDKETNGHNGVDILEKILVTGYLNHDELHWLLPLADIAIMAPKGPEAFGMVSVEAMSAGVLPLLAAHSGLLDVLDTVKQLDPELEEQMHITAVAGGQFKAMHGQHLVEVLPGKICTALEFLYPVEQGGLNDHTKRHSVGRRLRDIATKTWSWDGICKALITQ
ncbi:unnamed protein product [Owenia fusiformis]|uniref:Uncharacterized protein n=1 Tax=Owenia fusiformis TaxID=6347 RepID=A0A8J1XL74_OWEFU|nr:unnamed protein product [Owenia fusiformis]